MTLTSQVHRSVASGVRSFRRVQPSICLIIRNGCSRSNLRRNACQRRSMPCPDPVADDHSQTGSGSCPPGRKSASRHFNVPLMRGSSPVWSVHVERVVRRG
ncbi:hypothetical protein SAVERM_490 [Streptomyces avermitilis MA-4680 = NBRC 14893]|uniref:Uncharacterized protein n=1 Tax=Streptomyces avermitilis (strain ATCC 31267 / DSM 46492 / JCM 5070 / NBRC 14893 / NCIMB 12804 / NRRL 8165 / MA-4680) TaxID=227882 RepID=Q82QL5_STRAW|nr:hypothetical protein SAVERM_490 [Streptomyces avermitilis MA-4680 = NBRC 14893]